MTKEQLYFGGKLQQVVIFKA